MKRLFTFVAMIIALLIAIICWGKHKTNVEIYTIATKNDAAIAAIVGEIKKEKGVVTSHSRIGGYGQDAYLAKVYFKKGQASSVEIRMYIDMSSLYLLNPPKDHEPTPDFIFFDSDFDGISDSTKDLRLKNIEEAKRYQVLSSNALSVLEICCMHH